MRLERAQKVRGALQVHSGETERGGVVREGGERGHAVDVEVVRAEGEAERVVGRRPGGGRGARVVRDLRDVGRVRERVVHVEGVGVRDGVTLYG